MLRYSVKWQLGWQYWAVVVIGPVFFVFLLGLAYEHAITFREGIKAREVWSLAFLTCCLIVLLVVGYSAWRLWSLDRHPDLRALARYGSLPDLLADLNRELNDNTKLTIVPCPIHFLDLPSMKRTADAEVWLTPSWLVWVTTAQTRIEFMRLDSIVAVCRDRLAVVLVDHFNVHLRVPGKEEEVSRLLAEVLVRVPWALDHFDEKTEQTLKANPTQTIAEVDMRRRQIHEGPAPG